MPLRNFLVIVLSAILSMVCYARASRNRYVSTIAEAMNTITSEYVDEVDQRKLFEGAMNGMVDQLDPYSGYSPPEEYQQFEETMDQEFVGIGIYVELDAVSKRLTILNPLVGSPAYKAGIKAGDTIMSIDGHDTAGMSLKDSTALIKGKAGTLVKLSVQHLGDSKPVAIAVERAEIPVDSVLGDIRDAQGKWIFHLVDKPNIGYLRITNFGERTAQEMRDALQSYRQAGQHVDAVIIDMRGNSGGLLTAAELICDQFLDEGVIVSTRRRNNKTPSPPYEATKGVELGSEIPMVVMVDKYSASASEIVAACLQDHHRAAIVGQRSWGKGTVQNIVRLEGGKSALRLTIARYFRPSGKNIHKIKDAKDTDDWGVRPDPGLEVNLSSEEYEKWVMARRQRDIMTYSGAAQEPSQPNSTNEKNSSEAPSQPLVPAEFPPAPPAETSTPQPPQTSTSAPASQDDKQLRKAIEHLEQQLRRLHEPRPA